ncbi:MAG: response regulator [Xanthobacteraceae bacterium]
MSSRIVAESGAPLAPELRAEGVDIAAPAGDGTPLALVIDDQEEICRLVASTLAELGIESIAFQTAEPAIASLDQRRPAIIFLDIALSQSDAIDVIKGLSEKNYTGLVQLMSGGRPSLIEAIRRIATRYGLALCPPLQKPVKADAIRAVVASAGLQGDARIGLSELRRASRFGP